MKLDYFAIIINGEPLGFHTEAVQEPELSEDVVYALDEYSGNIWLATSREHAEMVAQQDTPWYNAGYSSPKNKFVGSEYKIARIILEIE